MKRSMLQDLVMTTLFISVPAMAGLPVSTTSTETAAPVAEKQPEVKSEPVEVKQSAAPVEKQTKVEPEPTPVPKAVVRRAPVAEVAMKGVFLGAEFAYKKLTAENDFLGVESTEDYKSGPINVLAGYTGSMGDIYGRYTLTDIEVDDYDGITEYGIGVRFHHPLKVGRTGFNARVEALFGDTDSDFGYKGALLGLGATTRMSKSVVMNYGVDYYTLNWDLPQSSGDGFYNSRNDAGFGFYVNMHLLFTH